MKLQTVIEQLHETSPRGSERDIERTTATLSSHLQVGTGHTRESCLLLDASAEGRGLRLPRPGNARDAAASVIGLGRPAAPPHTLCPGSQRDQVRAVILPVRREHLCAPI